MELTREIMKLIASDPDELTYKLRYRRQRKIERIIADGRYVWFLEDCGIVVEDTDPKELAQKIRELGFEVLE